MTLPPFPSTRLIIVSQLQSGLLALNGERRRYIWKEEEEGKEDDGKGVVRAYNNEISNFWMLLFRDQDFQYLSIISMTYLSWETWWNGRTKKKGYFLVIYYILYNAYTEAFYTILCRTYVLHMQWIVFMKISALQIPRKRDSDVILELIC
jgi:hypothetical protein